ncbi:hypothetical protein BT63DRAFT_130169 [Microthyrium microscopicum]|uniref:Uncharacterized protein n=1 Tax=Microthyrium microscopicum TaxID=703497 RepID=A0A6A6TUW6_9PEZI|nr:hypothetical protein BT63DRAFT_130169 [Microthyrium microscopicum]
MRNFYRLSTRLAQIQQRRYVSESTLPRIAQPSFWSSIHVVPKFLRRSPADTPKPAQSDAFRRWLAHPSTHLIILAMLAGSQAIQILNLKSDMDTQQHDIDRQLDKLKDVIERVQRGETVDVKEALGTGNPVEEAKWAQVIETLADDRRWLSRAQNRRRDKEAQKSDQKANSSRSLIPSLFHDLSDQSSWLTSWWSPARNTKGGRNAQQVEEQPSHGPTRPAFY